MVMVLRYRGLGQAWPRRLWPCRSRVYVTLSVPIEASTHFACGKYERAIKPSWDVNCLEMIPVHMLLHPGGLWVAIAIPSCL